MTAAALHALLSHWRRHPGQAATLALGLALATALWTGVQAINAEARASYDRAAAVVTQNNRPLIVAETGDPVPLERYVALRRAGWPVAPVLEGRSQFGGQRVTLLGLDPLSAPVLPAADSLEPDGSGLPDFIGPPGQLLGAPGTIAALDPPPGSPELVSSADVAPGTLVGDLSTVARLLERPDTLTRMVLLADPPARAPPLTEIAPGLRIAPPERGAELDGLTGSFHLNLTAFGLLSFTVGLFIVHGAIGLAFEQRRGMFRTLRALGLPARNLVALVSAELAIVALVAGVLGVALGYVIAAALLPDVAATLSGLYGAPASGVLTLRPGWVAAGMGIALAGTAIAATQSLTRLARLPVLAGAQPRAWRMATEAGHRLQGALALGLLVAAGLALRADLGLVGGFVALGGFLLGAALALPIVLVRLLALAERRATGPLASWFWADSRQQVPGLSLALMALMLALAANIGVSTMVGSFRHTFTGWLDQRLAAEIYLNAGTPARAAEIRDWLAPRTDAVLPVVFAEARIGGLPGAVQGLADHPTFTENWPLLAAAPEAWDSLARGAGMFVNEQFAYRAGVGVGETVPLEGRPRPVLAIYSDYGNPRPQAILGIDAFAEQFPGAQVQRLALRLPDAEVAALTQALRERFDLDSEAVVDQARLKQISIGIFERTFAVTGALNVLTLSVAALAIFTSLLTLAGQRLPQVAPVWALGLTRARLGRLELLRAALLAVLTALLALPVGLVLAWMLLAEVNVAAFGWRLPMRLFPGDWLLLTALAVGAAVLAAALPARRLARRPAADLLKVFSSER